MLTATKTTVTTCRCTGSEECEGCADLRSALDDAERAYLSAFYDLNNAPLHAPRPRMMSEEYPEWSKRQAASVEHLRAALASAESLLAAAGASYLRNNSCDVTAD